MRSQLIPPALQLVRAAGGDPGALCVEYGLPATAIAATEAELPIETFAEFFEAAALAADTPGLGVRLALSFQIGTFGVAEYACRTAPTVGDALTRLTRYIAILNELVHISLRRGGNGLAIIEQSVPGRPSVLGRHANEFFVVFIRFALRELTGVPRRLEQAWVAHSNPTDTLREEMAGVELRGSAEANGVAFDAAFLGQTNVKNDPNLNRIMEAQARDALEAMGRRHGPVTEESARVRQTIRELLDGGTPSVGDAARRLAMSPRTLQRRLAHRGTSFQAEVDAVRAELASVYIGDDRLSLAEIAFLLGYSDQSAFGRAYRRWTGKSPTEAR